MLPVVRGAWGLTLVAVPGWLITKCGGEATRRSRGVARVLGARHLLQAVVEARGGRRPGGGRSVLGRSVDLSHAGTAVALAATDRRWRRVASLDAVIATGFAAAGRRSGPGR